ncbi:S-layer homology domain-containing protein, partial [Caldanaerobius fijiensis DSM 17918]
MKKVKLFLALVLSAVVLVTSVPAFAADFYAVSDFPKYMYPDGSYYWAKNDLILAVAAEIFRGEQPYPPTLEYVFRGSGLNTCKVIGPLSPEKPINRASFAAILARALGLSQQAPNMPFKDVPSNEWYYPYVSELVNQDIIPVDYYRDGKFNPAGNITRLEIAIWVTNALAVNHVEMHAVTPSFKDYSQNDRWHLNVDYAVGMGILKGYDDGRFGPYDAATRGQAAVMIVRMMRKLPCDLTPDEALNTIKNAEAAVSKLEQAYMVDSEPDIVPPQKLSDPLIYNRIQKWQDALAQYQKEAKDYITDYNLYPWVESTAQVNYGQGTGANWGKPSYGGFDRLQKYGY